jgi:hypothetical protein
MLRPPGGKARRENGLKDLIGWPTARLCLNQGAISLFFLHVRLIAYSSTRLRASCRDVDMPSSHVIPKAGTG